MLRHTLLLIYRNFKRFKTTFFINLIGLSSGLACTLLIYLWVSDEMHFDKYHEKDSRLFQVMEHKKNEKGIETKGHTQNSADEDGWQSGCQLPGRDVFLQRSPMDKLKVWFKV